MAAEVVKALGIVLRQPVELSVAGRTDRGVHALGQVSSYDGPLPNLRSVNAVLPREIVVLRAEEMPPGFSARHDARSRSYVYRVLARRTPSAFERRRALWWPHRVDFEALEACAAALDGRHDFTAFTPKETYHRRFTRDIHSAQWRREGDILTFNDRGRLVHAQHEPDPRRDDARGRRGPPHARGLRRPARRRAAHGGRQHRAAVRALPHVGQY